MFQIWEGNKGPQILLIIQDDEDLSLWGVRSLPGVLPVPVIKPQKINALQSSINIGYNGRPAQQSHLMYKGHDRHRGCLGVNFFPRVQSIRE